MEVDRVRKVADMIEAHPEHFDMGSWGSGPGWWRTHARSDTAAAVRADLMQCGTTACIGGWAVSLWAADVDLDLPIIEAAGHVLGLDAEEADDLFYRWDIDQNRSGTADEAAAHLRQLADDYEAAGA